MKSFSIIQTGDHHLDPKNLAYTLPALDAVVAMVEEIKPDLFHFTGDAWIHRGRVDGDSGWKWRTRMERGADAAKHGATMTMGNHDQVFQRDKVDNITAVVAGADGVMSDGHAIMVCSKIKTVTFGDAIHHERVAIVHVPTPNKYWAENAIREAADLVKMTGTGSVPTIDQLLTMAIQGQIATARETVGPNGAVLVSYHGTVSGSKLGNEMVMTSGIDVAVSRDAFAGADLVMAGHIHNPQKIEATEYAPEIWYNGALTPLTFNDVALEPVIYKHTIHFNAAFPVTVETATIPVPVTSQMWDVEIDNFDDVEEYGIRTVLESTMNTTKDIRPTIGDRVRFVITAGKGIIRQITDDMLEAIRADGGFESVTKIVERVVDHTAAMDTTRTMSVLDGLDAWLAINHGSMTDSDLEFIRTIAREIETAVDDEQLDAHFSFMPVLLRVRNWAQYGEAEINFNDLEPLTAIRGQNTAGKSNLMRALPFALFKTLLFGDVIGDLVTNGERDGEVELYFKSTGAGVNGWYHIRRTIRKAANGRGATAKLFFNRSTAGDGEDRMAGGWEPVVKGTAGETEKAIQNLVGPPDLFLNTSFATQNAVDAVLNLGPSEFRDMLQTVLHRNFTARADASAVRRRSLEKTNTRLVNERGVHAQQAAKLVDVKFKLADAEGELDSATTLAAVADEGLAGGREALETATTEHARLTAVLDGHGAMLANHESVVKSVVDANNRLVIATAAVTQLEAVRRDIDVCGAVNVDAARKAAQRAMSMLEDGQNELAKFRNDAGVERDRVAGAVRDAETESTTSKHAAETLHNEATRVQRTVELMANVPCHGAKWNAEGLHDGLTEPVDMSTCQFLRDAAAARDRMPKLKAEYGVAMAKRNQKANAHVAARNAFDAYESTYATAETRLATAASALRVDVRDTAKARDTAEAAERKAAGLRATEAELVPVAGAHATHAAELAELADRLKASQKTMDAFDTDKMNVDMSTEDVTARRKRVMELEASATLMKNRVNESNAKANRYMVEVETATEAAAMDAELGDKIATGESMVVLFTVFETAVGRDGIPQLMLENMVLPAMQSMTNDYLTETDFRVTVEPDRANVDGAAKAGVFVSFTDSMGEHPLSAASGFQRVALGSAIRNALAGLHAESTGTKLWFAFQDEGFGAYDETNLAGAKVMVRRIAEDRRWFIYISHVDGMADVADSIIDVKKADGRSTVSIS